jgi:hypothetical protein
MLSSQGTEVSQSSFEVVYYSALSSESSPKVSLLYSLSFKSLFYISLALIYVTVVFFFSPEMGTRHVHKAPTSLPDFVLPQWTHPSDVSAAASRTPAPGAYVRREASRKRFFFTFSPDWAKPKI